MLPKRSTVIMRGDRAPWTALGVGLITLLLPAGGALLTIQNLRYLGQIDPREARRLTLAAIAIFAVGLSVLLLFATPTKNGVPQVDSNSALVLSLGTALASYAVQRAPFQKWRIANTGVRTSWWLMGLGIAVLYQVFVVLVAVIVLLVATHGRATTGIAAL